MSSPRSVVELLQELIRIPSVNPEGDPGVTETGEGACARYVGDFLETCGAAVTFEEVLPGRPNVIGRFPGRKEGKFRLLFAPHTDTVSVSGMSIDPFGGHIVEGKVTGRGASDTKGTMAAMLWALHELRATIPGLEAEVTFVGLMGEEAGQPGSRHFADNYRGEFDFAVVGEPTRCRIVHAHKGCQWIDLIAKGRAAHGASPQLGDNAIRKLLPALETVIESLESRLPAFSDPLLGEATVSLGKLQGGHSTNIVPDRCRASLDIRSTPSLFAAGGPLRIVEETLADAGFQDHVAVEVMVDAAPLHTDPSHPGIRALEKAGGRRDTAPWFCDAGRLAAGGIPAVACGPGNIAQAHTRDEFLSIADLEKGVRFYTQFLRQFAD